MHTGDYIRSVKFDQTMRGYKVADVEMFLDEVAEDMDKLVEQNRALNERLNKALAQINATSGGENIAEVEKPPVVDNSGSIQEVQSLLVSAQRFSDQIINEANEQAAAILEEANSKAQKIDEKVATVLSAFEKDIAERKSNADAEVTKMLSDAAVKSEGIITAAHDSVARQQLLFDKLKVEATEFKKKMFELHKEQLSVLQKYPDSVPYDPEHAAKALVFDVNSQPDFLSFLPATPDMKEETLEEPALTEDKADLTETVADEKEEVNA